MNLETITNLQWWCKTLLLNGFNLIRAKQTLHRKLKGACKSSWSRQGNQKSFTLTVHWILAKPVKIFPGIIVRQHHIKSETNGIAERAVRRIKEGTSAVLLESGLDGKWWADSMECSCYLRNIQDKISDVKTPFERRFGESFQRAHCSVWFIC